MQILGFIICIVGIALIVVGKNISRSFPAESRNDEDELLTDMLKSLEKGFGIGGGIMILIGIVLFTFYY